MPYGTVQEHWESSRIENAISYYYHHDRPPKKEVTFSSGRKHHKEHLRN